MNHISSVLAQDTTYQPMHTHSDTPPQTQHSVPQSEKHTTEFDLKTLIASLKKMQQDITHALSLLESNTQHNIPEPYVKSENIIEGVFNGEHMIGADGKEYRVPPNYASKSKLVEGDMMKLTILQNGQYKYKQIGPIERKHVVGELLFDTPNNQWRVLAEGNMYNVLSAAVTYHKARAGHTVSIILPQGGESAWAAFDHIV